MKRVTVALFALLITGGIFMAAGCAAGNEPDNQAESDGTAAVDDTPTPVAAGTETAPTPAATPHPLTTVLEIPETITVPKPYIEPEPVDPAVRLAENKTPRYPFPQHAHDLYTVPPLLPDNKTQDELDGMIVNFFRQILLNDLIVDETSPANKDEFRMVFRHYLEWQIRNDSIQVSHLTCSESHGYGMLMLAYMAGSEERLNLAPDEWIYGSESLKDYFDAMLRTVQAFPSRTGGSDNKLFAWELVGNPRDGRNRTGYVETGGMKHAPFSRPATSTSATDGDMDIIYSLLLADKQWGSDGVYNYRQIALDMLESFWEYCINTEHHSLLLGDWAANRAGTRMGDATRPCDFMLAHLRAFAEADPSRDWQSVIDACLDVIKEIRDAQNELGNTNGLMPDYVVREDGKWVVPDRNVLEGYDAAFAYNACRVPWRQSTYYLLYGDVGIGGGSLFSYIIEPINDYAKNIGSLGRMGPVNLDGTSIGWTDPHLFGPPFILPAASGNDADWVNATWGWTGLTTYNGDNYADYIKMLVMLTASGNYWRP
jgi:hypothetical protein